MVIVLYVAKLSRYVCTHSNLYSDISKCFFLITCLENLFFHYFCIFGATMYAAATRELKKFMLVDNSVMSYFNI